MRRRRFWRFVRELIAALVTGVALAALLVLVGIALGFVALGYHMVIP